MNNGIADPTQSLLRWGIEHAAPGSLPGLHADIQAGRRPDLNTDVLKAIMGTTDADRMKECVEVIEGRWVDRDDKGLSGKDVTVEDQLRAWDDLEMVSLVVSASVWYKANARGWTSDHRGPRQRERSAPRLFLGERMLTSARGCRPQVQQVVGAHLQARHRPERRGRPARVLGLRDRRAGASELECLVRRGGADGTRSTLLQNNPRAQSAVRAPLVPRERALADPESATPLSQFLELDPLPTLLPLLTSTTISAAVRGKAMYCLSSTLKHSDAAVARFSELDGWSSLNRSLQGASSRPCLQGG